MHSPLYMQPCRGVYEKEAEVHEKASPFPVGRPQRLQKAVPSGNWAPQLAQNILQGSPAGAETSVPSSHHAEDWLARGVFWKPLAQKKGGQELSYKCLCALPQLVAWLPYTGGVLQFCALRYAGIPRRNQIQQTNSKRAWRAHGDGGKCPCFTFASFHVWNLS